MAINYFTIKGYTISIPLNDTQWYDLIIEKDGIFKTVQCKATFTENSKIDLRSTGGTKGSTYDNVLNHKDNLDYLFCVNKDLKNSLDIKVKARNITKNTFVYPIVSVNVPLLNKGNLTTKLNPGEIQVYLFEEVIF